MKLEPTTLVPVCSSCMHASCFIGAHFCIDYRRAGVLRVTVEGLRRIATGEHESWWRRSVEHFS